VTELEYAARDDTRAHFPGARLAPRSVADCAALVTDRYSFVDSLAVLVPRHLRKAEIKSVRELCGSLYRVDEDPPTWAYAALWVMHQPSAAALELIDSIQTPRRPPLVVGLEVALDFVTATEEDAHAVRRFFQNHLAQAWQSRNAKGVDSFVDAHYADYRAGAAQAWVAYSDQPCRVTGEVSCCHLEWRIRRAAGCRRVGVGRPADVLGFEHVAFWRCKLRLRRIDVQKLGRQLSKGRHARRWIRKGIDMYRMAVLNFLHAIQTEYSDEPPMELVIRELRKRKIKPDAVLVPLDNSLLLPC
jgi:hypothetical protein